MCSVQVVCVWMVFFAWRETIDNFPPASTWKSVKVLLAHLNAEMIISSSVLDCREHTFNMWYRRSMKDILLYVHSLVENKKKVSWLILSREHFFCCFHGFRHEMHIQNLTSCQSQQGHLLFYAISFHCNIWKPASAIE